MSVSFPLRPFASTLAAVLTAANVLFAVPAAAQTCGDVSGDDNVLASDALLVLRKAVGQDVALTCNGDGCEALEALEVRVAQLESLLANFSVTSDAVVVSGKNLQIVSGEGSTAAEPNGLGNLIVGYNEGVGAQDRTGSHNIVVGREHEYTSFGGIVAGNTNTISGAEASVLGGSDNEAAGDRSTVSGGNNNRAGNDESSVAGGFLNVASGVQAAIAGGCENTATATYSAVSGGQKNDATASWATVGGGFDRTSSGAHDWRAGGLFETQ